MHLRESFAEWGEREVREVLFEGVVNQARGEGVDSGAVGDGLSLELAIDALGDFAKRERFYGEIVAREMFWA